MLTAATPKYTVSRLLVWAALAGSAAEGRLRQQHRHHDRRHHRRHLEIGNATQVSTEEDPFSWPANMQNTTSDLASRPDSTSTEFSLQQNTDAGLAPQANASQAEEEAGAGSGEDDSSASGSANGDESEESAGTALGAPLKKTALDAEAQSDPRKYAKAREEWAEKVDKVDSVQEKAARALEANLAEQNRIQTEIDDIENEDGTKKAINAHVGRVSNETGTPLFAAFIGDMWKDMTMFSAPPYLQELGTRLKALKKDEVGLQRAYKSAKARAEKTDWKAAEKTAKAARAEKSEEGAEARKVDDDEDEEAGADEEEPVASAPSRKRAEPSRKRAEGGPSPMFTVETMPPVSPTVQCIIMLCTQYFAVYTVLMVVRTANNFTAGRYQTLQGVAETATITVTYALMLSILFLATRMRAVQLSQGETEKYRLPQPWVQFCMYLCTLSVLVQVLMVVLIPLVGGKHEPLDEEGHPTTSQPGGTTTLILTAIRYATMAGLYCGIVGVIVGIFIMPQPKEIWGGQPVPVSPAVACVIILNVAFFTAYLGMALVRSIRQVKGENWSESVNRFEGVMQNAKFTVNLAPMCCILFIAARMRALQIDPKNGNPQAWAQVAFYATTIGIVLQTAMVIALPLIFGKGTKIITGPSEGEVVVTYANASMNSVSSFVRYACLLGIYGGVVTVIVSICTIEAEDPAMTPPVSPAAKCTIILACLYFLTYTALFLCNTAEEMYPGRQLFQDLVSCFEACTKTVMFAPMLATLFWAARLRALQLTKATDGTVPPTAGPQPWAQQAMYLATWSVLIQLVMVLSLPWVLGRGENESKTTPDGMYRVPTGAPLWAGIAVDTVKWLCVAAMYGGMVAVIAAVYLMTPETLPPYADDAGLVAGVEAPPPPMPE